jgi:hypothetical protein
MRFDPEAVVSADIRVDHEWYGLFHMRLRVAGYRVYGRLVNGQEVLLGKCWRLDEVDAILEDVAQVYGLTDEEAR